MYICRLILLLDNSRCKLILSKTDGNFAEVRFCAAINGSGKIDGCLRDIAAAAAGSIILLKKDVWSIPAALVPASSSPPLLWT